jgi:hypothetical protein
MKLPYRSIVLIGMLSLLSACASTSKKASGDGKQADFVPKLKRPEVRKVWVPDQIVGDEYISGHWKFVLEKNAVWTKEN